MPRTDEWAVNGNERGAANLVAYQKHLARKDDLSLTHTIVHPTIDKSQGDAPGPGNDVALHKVGDTEHGIIVRGARILATLAPFADEMAVYPGDPAARGRGRLRAVVLHSDGHAGAEDSSAATASRADGKAFDHPLSSRFDEQDAFVDFRRCRGAAATASSSTRTSPHTTP